MCRDNCNKAVNIDVNLKNLSFDENFGPQEKEEDVLPVLEYSYNHTIDALRYALEGVGVLTRSKKIIDEMEKLEESDSNLFD